MAVAGVPGQKICRDVAQFVLASHRLTLTVVLTALMVAPYAVYRASALGGLWQVFLRPLPGDNPFDDEWAHRAYRAHMNAFEGLALFAPLAIAVYVTNAGNETTASSRE